MKYMHTSYVPSPGDIIEYAYVDDYPNGDEARPFFDSVEELRAYERALINASLNWWHSDQRSPGTTIERGAPDIVAAARRACKTPKNETTP